MKIPEYADPRAHKFFHMGYVGANNGDDGSAYTTFFDTRHEDLEETKTYGGRYCVYCGCHPYSIQPSDKGFNNTGYLCICKNAMDEIDHRHEMTELQNALYRLSLNAPKPSVEVKKKLIDKELKNDYNYDRILKTLGYTS